MRTLSPAPNRSILPFLLSNFALVACLFLATAPARAQFRASIQGTVTDTSGAVIPGATVSLKDNATNHVTTATTSGSGVYTFNALPPNRFTLTVDATGFKKKVLTNVQIRPEQANAINVQLDLGQAAQTVTVNGAQAALLDTETATLSGTVTSKQIQHLPSFNRDVFQLAQLAPGVFGDGSQGSSGGSFDLPGNAGPGGSASSASGIFQTENQVQVQAVGGQTDQNGISVDGISTVSAVWGGASVITPSEDSVENVTIVSNNYDAENGRFSGAQIQVISKSGTNNLHGSAFFKASRPGLNAYQRFNGYRPGLTAASTPEEKGVNRDEDRTNNYGGSLGGPIWKNKIFAFFDYETSPLVGSETAQQWFETPQFDTSAATPGSIAAKFLSFPGERPANNTLIAENCGQIGLTEGVNCHTTSNGLDVGSPLKTGLGHQDLTYGNNTSTPGVGGGLDGVADLALYNVINPTTISQSQYNGRLDAIPDSKDHVTFAIYWVPVTKTDYNGPNRAANLWHHSQVNDAFSLIWNHTFSPTLLNQARANAAGWRYNEVASNPQAPFGLPQDNVTGYDLTGGLQYFGPPGPAVYDQWTYDYNDILTKTLNSQNIKVGGEVTRLYYLNSSYYNARPQFNFNNLWDFANDATNQETGQFDALTGVPFANRQDDRVNMFAAFLQDDYKVLPNLTLNLGLRWSYFGGMYSKQNNLSVLQFGPGASALSGMHLRVGGHLYTPQKSNFGPQFGFSWQPKQSMNKAVVRGGFGINYNQNEIAITANGIGNPPSVFNANFLCAYPYTTNPTCAGHGIVYETAGNINSLFGYAPNPAAISAFGSDNFPVNYGNGVSVTGFPSNPKTIATYHYSLEFEYQLPYDSVFTVGYQGNQSRHLLTQMNYNVVALAQGLPLNPKANFIDYYPNTANANYNAMITTVRHNFAHEFQAEAQYTWSKAMDEGSSPYEEDPYPFDVHQAYGRSDYNVQNAFKLFGLWQPIFFRGSHTWAEKVFGGWSLGGIFNVHSGFPFNPIYNTTGPYYQGSGYGALRPARVEGGAGSSTANSTFMGATNPNYGGDATKFFTAPKYVQGPAFPATAPPPVPGIHRNSLTGPGYQDLDASLTKAFGIPNNRVLGTNAVFEVRADAYNLFNKININGESIDNLVGSVAPDGTLTSINSHFGAAGTSNAALGSRTVQLQARFSF
jgi:hypothetical protein